MVCASLTRTPFSHLPAGFPRAKEPAKCQAKKKLQLSVRGPAVSDPLLELFHGFCWRSCLAVFVSPLKAAETSSRSRSAFMVSDVKTAEFEPQTAS